MTETVPGVSLTATGLSVELTVTVSKKRAGWPPSSALVVAGCVWSDAPGGDAGLAACAHASPGARARLANISRRSRRRTDRRRGQLMALTPVARHEEPPVRCRRRASSCAHA